MVFFTGLVTVLIYYNAVVLILPELLVDEGTIVEDTAAAPAGNSSSMESGIIKLLIV